MGNCTSLFIWSYMTEIFLTLMLLPLSFVVYLVVWGLILNTHFGLNYHRQVFKGALTNAEFDALLDKLFSGPVNYTGFEVVGGGYTVWVANDYYGFKINGESDFSLMQKRKFFKIWNKAKRDHTRKKTQEALQQKELALLASKNGKLIYGKE